MKQNTVFLTVEPGDIFMFGDYTFWPEENEGNTVIDFFDAGKYDWHTSYIMLRNILRAIGSEYKVWRMEDYTDEKNSFHLRIFTNLPKDVYEAACAQSLLKPTNPDCIWADDCLLED